MPSQGYLVDHQECIVGEVEPDIVVVRLGSVFLQHENVHCYSEKTKQQCGSKCHHGVLQILNPKSMSFKTQKR
jgi:hypothetical protein